MFGCGQMAFCVYIFANFLDPVLASTAVYKVNVYMKQSH